jgi:hypothetical protein
VTTTTCSTITTTTTATAVDRNGSSSSTTPASAAVKPATDGEGLSSVDFPLLSASVTHPKRGSGSTKHASTKRSSGPVVAAPQEAQWVAVAEPHNQLMTPGSAANLPGKGSSTALSYSRVINSTTTAAGSQDIRNSTHTAVVSQDIRNSTQTAAASQDIRNSLTASKSAAPGQLTHRASATAPVDSTVKSLRSPGSAAETWA